MRGVAVGAGKTGTVHAFDADTGEELWVTSVGIHQNDHLSKVPAGQTIVVYPGSLGGVETFTAYAEGVVYVPVMNLPMKYTSTTKKTESLDGTGSIVAIDVESGDELHELLSGLPLFPYMDIEVMALTRHPSRVDD